MRLTTLALALTIVVGLTSPGMTQESDDSCVQTELGHFCLTVEDGVLVITQVSSEQESGNSQQSEPEGRLVTAKHNPEPMRV